MGWLFQWLPQPRAPRVASPGPRRAPTEAPGLVVLQAVARAMDCTDVAHMRLVSKHWRCVFGQQISNVTLPPSVWQHPEAGDPPPATDVLRVFPAAGAVQLQLDPLQPLLPGSMRAAFERLAKLPALRHLIVSSFTQPQHWSCLADCLPLVAQQVTCITLSDVTWPAPPQLAALKGLARLQRLNVSCPHLSRLDEAHVQAVTQMSQLRHLRMAFRIVAGTAHTPLRLAPLSNLTQLTELTLEFTGLRELSCAASCHPASALGGLQSLQRLHLLHIPCEDLSTLPALPALTQLAFHACEPLSQQQLASVAACARLRALDLHAVRWEALPALGRMSGLRTLSLQLHAGRTSARGAVQAGQSLTALTGLTGLREMALHGPAAVTQGVLCALGGAWSGLSSLSLCCTFPTGTHGLESFSRLRQLALAPFEWDVWSNEPPLMLYPGSLPGTLTSLVAMDVWVAADSPRCDAVTLPTPCLKRLVLRTLSPCERPLLLPDWSLAQQVEQLEISHSQLMPEHLHHIGALQARSFAAAGKAAAEKQQQEQEKQQQQEQEKQQQQEQEKQQQQEQQQPAEEKGVKRQQQQQQQHMAALAHRMESECSLGGGPETGAGAGRGEPHQQQQQGVLLPEQQAAAAAQKEEQQGTEGGAIAASQPPAPPPPAAAPSPRQGRSPPAPSSSSAAARRPITPPQGNYRRIHACGVPRGGGVGPGGLWYDISDLHRLRPLRLLGAPPAARRSLDDWRLQLSQWKHQVLLQLGASFSYWEGLQLYGDRGGWGLAGSAFELLLNGEEDDEAVWL